MARRPRPPFFGGPDEGPPDEDLVALAVDGDRAALEQVVRRHQAWIYNVAVRMVWDPTDAEDVTQEVLVKVVTKLATFRGESAFRTWLYRIVANHVLNMRRRTFEQPVSFEEFGAGLAAAPESDAPDARLLVEDAKMGCTTAMLLCLDRRQRLVYVLGEIFGVPDRAGAEITGLSRANFRQVLHRARRDLHAFMRGQCGLVDPANPCRCARKTRAFIEQGYVDPDRLRFAKERVERVRDVAPLAQDALDDALAERARDVQRDGPFLEPPDLVARVLELGYGAR